ncbi:MAG: DUF4349 domain-containing protein, partial [Gemmatimonas sp.]
MRPHLSYRMKLLATAAAVCAAMAPVVSCSRGDDVTVPRAMAKSEPAQAGGSGDSKQDFVSVSRASKSAPAPMSAPSDATSPASAEQVANSSAAAIVAPTMVIRNGAASIEVDSLDAAIAAVQRLAAGLGGYIGNTSQTTGSYAIRSAELELKIPAARYEAAISGLTPIGKVESQTSTAEDVGEEFVDVTARQNNAHKLEERLITLLATRTGKLEDVLAVERELARVREEIERYEGRLRYLKSHVATSTLVITVHEKKPVVTEYAGQNVIVESFKNA